MLDEEKVRQALDELRPLLQRDGGDVEFVGIEDDVLKVRLLGMCAGCPMAAMTVKHGIEARIREKVPELKAVVAVP